MDIETYFEHVNEGEVLIRGTRVDVASVLDAYRDGLSPEEIAYNFPTLTLEQVYATLTYYLANRTQLDAQMRAGGSVQPSKRGAEPPVVGRLRALAAQRRSKAAATG